MIDMEYYKVSDPAELFDPYKSRVAPLFTQMCTNTYFMNDVANEVLDPEKPHSLMHIIVRYTITRDSKSVRNKEFLDSKTKDYWLGGIFAACHYQYEEREQHYRESCSLTG